MAVQSYAVTQYQEGHRIAAQHHYFANSPEQALEFAQEQSYKWHKRRKMHVWETHGRFEDLELDTDIVGDADFILLERLMASNENREPRKIVLDNIRIAFNSDIDKQEMDTAYQLIQALKSAGMEIANFFWKYVTKNMKEFTDEREIWRLTLAAPICDEIGISEAYCYLDDMLKSLPEELTEEYSICNIELISPSSKEIDRLRKFPNRYYKEGFNG